MSERRPKIINRPQPKNPTDLAILVEGGRRLSGVIKALVDAAKPGVRTKDLDGLARRLIAELGVEPAFLNYQPADARRPFPAALCVSVNDEVVHGIPGDRELLDGDLVSLDLGLRHEGLYTDMAVTISIGEPTRPARRLLKATREALSAGIRAARPGATAGDVGAAVQAVARRYGFGLVRELGGHGVGYAVHEPPLIPNYGRPGQGPRLTPDLVIAIEPMLVLGDEAVDWAADGYTVRTKDGGLAAHFEHTVWVSPDGPKILTA